MIFKRIYQKPDVYTEEESIVVVLEIGEDITPWMIEKFKNIAKKMKMPPDMFLNTLLLDRISTEKRIEKELGLA